MTLTNSTISGNTVSSNIFAGSGGGIFNHGGTVNIINSTLSGNSAIGPGGTSVSGGGILTNVGTVSIANSTISGNTADFGGGIRNVNGGVVSSKNSIIALNTSASGPDVNGPLASQGFNLIGIPSGATITPAQLSDQIGVTPTQLNLGPLQDNGGPTPTHALLSGSFAIDQGYSSGSTTDQRGCTRPVDDPAIPNAIGGDGSDIGAFEYGAIVPRLYLPLILG
jgi:fibronectin-binding autotransporter adhesin